MRGEKTEHELLGRHFQSEEGDIVAWTYKLIFIGVVSLTKHVARHAEREGGFANSGSGGQNDHFAGLKAGGELIELIETGGDTAVVALAFDEALDNGDGFRGDLGSAEDSLGFPTATDFEDIALGLIEDGLDFVRAFMGADDDLGASLLQFAKETFVLDLIEVGLGGENTDDSCGEVADEGGSPSGVGEFTIGQPCEEGGGVDRLTAFAHFGDTAEDDLVGWVDKVFLPHSLFPG